MTRESRATEDPAFASAVEKAYLRQLYSLEEGTGPAKLTLHSDLLERAIYQADPTHGGLRFKNLAGALELEARLLRALSKRLD